MFRLFLTVFLHSWGLHNYDKHKIYDESRVGFFFHPANLWLSYMISSPAAQDLYAPHAQPDHRLEHDFRLVSFDAFGIQQLLPPGLGNLPLYFDDDGFHSVNGPLDLTANSPCAVVTPVNHDANFTTGALIISSPNNKKPSISPNLHQRHLNDDAVSRFVISLENTHLSTPLIIQFVPP